MTKRRKKLAQRIIRYWDDVNPSVIRLIQSGGFVEIMFAKNFTTHKWEIEQINESGYRVTRCSVCGVDGYKAYGLDIIHSCGEKNTLLTCKEFCIKDIID